MSLKAESYSLLDRIFSIIQDLYVYCHLKTELNEPTFDIKQDQALANSIMWIMIIISSFTMIKVLAIFLYFLVVNVIVSVCKFCVHSYRRKCKSSLTSEIKFACYYLVKIVKKLYTYNFYSYENKVMGFVIVTIYLIFIIFNIVFAVEYRSADEERGNNTNTTESTPDSVKIIQIIAFELSIFVELFCCSFYITRSLIKQLSLVITSFTLLNGVVITALCYKIFYSLADTDEKPRRVVCFFFVVYFSVLFLISLVKIAKYDLNLEAWNCLLREKQKFYHNKHNEVACLIINDEKEKLSEISTRIKLNNVYVDSKSPFFFKKRDRFYHRKKIITLILLIIIMNMTELSYIIFRLVDTRDDQNETVHRFRVVQKFFSCFHMISLLLLSWFVFLKLEVKTIIKIFYSFILVLVLLSFE